MAEEGPKKFGFPPKQKLGNRICLQKACSAAYLPENPNDAKAILKILLEAERCAVRFYTEICNMTYGKDRRTYDISLAILQEEVEHEAWFQELLEGRPSGHFRRRTPREGPYTQKFRHIE